MPAIDPAASLVAGGITTPCDTAIAFVTAADISRSVLSSYEVLSWIAYSEADHALTENWGTEPSTTQAEAIDDALRLLWQSESDLASLVSILDTLIANATGTQLVLLEAVRAVLAPLLQRLSSEDFAASGGYTGPLVVGVLNDGNPWVRLIERSPVGEPSPLQELLGDVTLPAAVAFPLNWGVATISGLADPTAAGDDSGYEGFVLPRRLRTLCQDVGADLQAARMKSAGAWAALGVLAGGVVGLLLVLVLLLVTGELAELGRRIEKAGREHLDGDKSQPRQPANEALAFLLNAVAGTFEEAGGLQIAQTLNDVFGAWNTIAKHLNAAIADFCTLTGIDGCKDWEGLSRAEAIPDVNSFTGLEPAELRVIAATLREENLGTIVENGEAVPMVHVRACMLGGASLSQYSRGAEVVQALGNVVNLAGSLAESMIALDDAAASISGFVQSGSGVLPATAGQGLRAAVGAQLARATAGKSVPYLVGRIWRQQLADRALVALAAETGVSIQCLEAAFCWMATQSQRDRVDAIFGPRNSAFNGSSLLPGRNVTGIGQTSAPILWRLLSTGQLCDPDWDTLEDFLSEDCSPCFTSVDTAGGGGAAYDGPGEFDPDGPFDPAPDLDIDPPTEPERPDWIYP